MREVVRRLAYGRIITGRPYETTQWTRLIALIAVASLSGAWFGGRLACDVLIALFCVYLTETLIELDLRTLKKYSEQASAVMAESTARSQ